MGFMTLLLFIFNKKILKARGEGDDTGSNFCEETTVLEVVIRNIKMGTGQFILAPQYETRSLTFSYTLEISFMRTTPRLMFSDVNPPGCYEDRRTLMKTRREGNVQSQSQRAREIELSFSGQFSYTHPLLLRPINGSLGIIIFPYLTINSVVRKVEHSFAVLQQINHDEKANPGLSSFLANKFLIVVSVHIDNCVSCALSERGVEFLAVVLLVHRLAHATATRYHLGLLELTQCNVDQEADSGYYLEKAVFGGIIGVAFRSSTAPAEDPLLPDIAYFMTRSPAGKVYKIGGSIHDL
ncbi:uncharacterized protein EV420DRAFT_1714661 [Desarmillaria tabescens]|uniref:Uncharacterized protein n=1 Tax=Armillaria tabescens TaxID=1929756 RepID=A0AA39JT79_ARMTA|nr:uncharacterized protein EV420DRAFT_1714661 [Desarmillaria tabescens]KAK0447024.1 hypothetical protein EV420DRAFT_1714661 [Desarmillaria tabescens]